MRDFDIGHYGKGACAIGGVVLMLVLSVWGFSYDKAYYRIFLLEMEGKAKLAEAEQTKKILVEEARAEKRCRKIKG